MAERTRRSPSPARATLTWATLLGGSAIFLIPFVWMVRVALIDENQLNRGLALLVNWRGLHPENFTRALTIQPFHCFFFNTLLITLAGLAGEVLSSSLAAYGFARKRFPGKTLIFIIMISTMMLPPQVTMIPVFILFRNLGWVNTYKPLIVPSFFGAAFSIFLMRQFFMSIPKELDEAAYIDGCSSFQVYWRILLPLSMPAVMTVAIFSFIGRWNDLLGPLIYLDSSEKYTLALGLMSFRGMYSTQWHLLMAASLVVMLPCIVLFFAAQKYFIKGIMIGGIKG